MRPPAGTAAVTVTVAAAALAFVAGLVVVAAFDTDDAHHTYDGPEDASYSGHEGVEDRAPFMYPGAWGPPRRRPWNGGGGWGRPAGSSPRPAPVSMAQSGPGGNRGDGGGGGWGWPLLFGNRRPASTTPAAPRAEPASAGAGAEAGAGTCGRTAVLNRVVGGEEALLGQFPWQAALFYRRGNSGAEVLQCGGALVSPRYVVTAAHCLHTGVIRNWRLVRVRLGEWDTSAERDCDANKCAQQPLDFRPEARLLHPGYAPSPRGGASGARNEADIALVRLDRPAPYTDYIRPVCLPWGDASAAGDLAGQTLIVAGWGRTETADGSPRLLFAALPALALAECSRRLQVSLSATQMCAGAAGKDACKGDSGGPLLRTAPTPDGEDSIYQLVGVVSFGPELCGTDSKPGAYTRVAAFLPWLRENMRP